MTTQTSQRTYMAKAGEVPSRWFLVDARGQTLGRLSVNIARVLRGKHRPQFTPHLNTGDHIVVVNAADIVVTGGKARKKLYDRYSGYPGGAAPGPSRSPWNAIPPSPSATRSRDAPAQQPGRRHAHPAPHLSGRRAPPRGPAAHAHHLRPTRGDHRCQQLSSTITTRPAGASPRWRGAPRPRRRGPAHQRAPPE